MATILTIIPYKFYPPMGGGALRCFYMLRAMAFKHTVYVLTVQPLEDFTIPNEPAFPANVQVISIDKNKKYHSFVNRLSGRIGDALNYRFLRRSLTGETDTSLLEIYPALKLLLKEKNFDIIYYENLEALGLLGKIISRKSPASLKLYDAHNCDSSLWMQQALLEKKKVLFKYSKLALAVEKYLFKKVDGFFCCSEADNKKLSALNKNRIQGIVIPNGVDTEARPYDTNADKYLIHNIIFCGSLDYFPNAEGLRWFYNNVFPMLKEKIPTISLTVIGNVTQVHKYDYLKNDASVNFIGNVETVVPFYKQASVSIVPLLSGSGTRLKILEAMSMGNPVVSTAIGAEGMDFENGKHLLIADDAKEFADQVLYLLNNKELFNHVRTNAFELVKSVYDWKKIGLEVNTCIEKLLIKKKLLNSN
jgi:glycosyltransferase involved in cell wall biosynthesis